MANNVETMREALKFIKQYFDKIDPFNINTYTFSQIEVEHINEAIDAALARPLRNCDVGTPKEQAERWYWRYHVGRLCQSCPLGPRRWSEVDVAYMCFSEWLQMPYTAKEGGAECT